MTLTLPDLFDHPLPRPVVKGLRRRDPVIWNNVVVAFAPPVFNFLAQRLDDRAACEDLLQDVFAAAVTSADRFDPALGGLTGWLLGIARHRLLAHRRSTARRVRRMTGTDPADLDRQPAADEPEPGDLAEQVNRAVSLLPPDQQTLLRDRYQYGHSQQAIADRLGITRSAAGVRIHRAKAAFEQALADLDKETTDDRN